MLTTAGAKGTPQPFYLPPSPSSKVGSHAGRVGTKRIKEQLTGLKSWHVDLGLDASLLDSDSLRRTIRGIGRYHGEAKQRQAIPITLPILRNALRYIRANPTMFGGLRAAATLTAAYSLAFAAFLRCGSFTYDGGKFDRTFCLSRAHVHLTGPTPYFHLPADKTDTFRHGVDVHLPTNAPEDVCPIRAIQYLMLHWPGQPHEPLFSLSGALPHFPRSLVIDKYLAIALRETRVPGKFTGHSFRRGAATWAASVGYSADEIKLLGRWTSDCFRRYVDTPATRKCDVVNGLFTRPSSLSTNAMPVFDPDD